MLYVYLGTDRTKARGAMDAAIEKFDKGRAKIRITDANAPADLDAALQGGGMFDLPRVVVFEGIFGNDEMRERLIAELPRLKESPDPFFLFEEKLDAAGKRSVAKYAEALETFDAPKAAKDNTIFKLRFALEKGDKKTLWVGLMHEIAAGKAPEATHGFLFWAAKQMVLNARGQASHERAQTLLARLAELPQESRRKGFDLEYALERFALSEV